jgi:hypothetical protein
VQTLPAVHTVGPILYQFCVLLITPSSMRLTAILLSTTLTTRTDSTRRYWGRLRGSWCRGLPGQRIVIPSASRDIGQSFGASDLLPRYRWVVGIAKPVETPVATSFECFREYVAVLAMSNTAVCGTPDISLSELFGASIVMSIA